MIRLMPERWMTGRWLPWGCLFYWMLQYIAWPTTKLARNIHVGFSCRMFIWSCPSTRHLLMTVLQFVFIIIISMRHKHVKSKAEWAKQWIICQFIVSNCLPSSCSLHLSSGNKPTPWRITNHWIHVIQFLTDTKSKRCIRRSGGSLKMTSLAVVATVFRVAYHQKSLTRWD